MSLARLKPLLVAEDSADDLFLFTRLLKKADVPNPLHIVSDGEEAVALLTRMIRQADQLTLPLVTFVDIKMPRMDGFELLAWIRTQRPLDGMPVVMISSSVEERDVVRASRLGAQYYFAKYPTETTIAQVIEAAGAAPVSASRRSRSMLPSNLLPPLPERYGR